MQRTNILRDIDEDAADGPRLPRRRDGRALRRRRARAARARCCATRSRAPTRSTSAGCAGIGELRRGRRAIAAAAAMYREILRQIERDGYGARAGRAVVPPRRKLAVALRAAARP